MTEFEAYLARFTPTSSEEAAVIAHLRGWAHDHTLCELCRVLDKQFEAFRERLAANLAAKKTGA